MGGQRPTYVVTAPSGTGKTTLNRRLVKDLDDVIISVSFTTREKRDKEVDGDHYWFISEESFSQKLKEGRLLEWAEVFGNFYGTSLDELNRIHELQKRPLLEIDVQGWNLAREKLPDAISIFIMPPSMRTLWNRLEHRGTDSLEVRCKRIQTARQELDHGHHYQYFVINDDLDRAYSELKQIFNGTAPALSYEAGISHCEKLQRECGEAWFADLSKL